MVSCASCGCSLTQKNKNSGVTLHRFPKDPNRRTQWINSIKKPDFIPDRNSFLCSHHFAEDCFDRTSMVKVRLLPNAVPTIEVDRLKYARIHNPVVVKHMNNAKNKMTDMSVLSPMPGSSTREQTPSPLLEMQEEDTPCKRELKRKFSDLERTSILKSHAIRRLQKKIWRQKKQISSLKVGIHNPVVKLMKDVENKMTDMNALPSIPRTTYSAREQTPSPAPEVHEEDTPCTRELKRKISDLGRTNILKSRRIQRLQKESSQKKKEISLLKVGIHNPVVKHMKDEEKKMTDMSVLSPIPRSSAEEQTPHLLEMQEKDTPHKRELKRKISDLGRTNIVKNYEIRRSQKKNWGEKKQISLLKVGILNPAVKHMKDVENKTTDLNVLSPIPGTSAKQTTPLLKMQEDSPHKRELKRKINDFGRTNIVNNQEILRSQKKNWREKKQISLLKVGIHNPVVKHIKDVENKMTDMNVVLPIPGTSADQTSPLSEMQEDTPRKSELKREISDLGRTNIAKNHEIRRSQKKNWREKKQISLLKVRIYNPVVKHMKDVENKTTDMSVSSPMPKTSAREQTPSPLLEMPEDTSRKRELKRKISALGRTSILKSQEIRRLQKTNWRQKKQISALKVIALELIKKNNFLHDHQYAFNYDSLLSLYS